MMSAVDIASIIDPMELPRGVAKGKPQYEEYSAGNIMGLGVDIIHGDLYVDDWYQVGRNYKERLYRNHILDHRLVISEDIHHYQIPEDIDEDDVVGKVSKAMVAGEIIGSDSRSGLLGKRGEQPLNSRSVGKYYQFYLYQYDAGDCTVVIHYNLTPSDAGSGKEVEVALGTQNKEDAEKIFNDVGFSAVNVAAMTYFLPPLNKPVKISVISSAVEKLSSDVKERIGIAARSATNSAMAVDGVGGTPPILPIPDVRNESRLRSPDAGLTQIKSTETMEDDASIKDPGELRAYFLRELRKFEDSIKAGVLKKIILQVDGALDTPVNLGELYKDDLEGLADTLVVRAINKRPKGGQGAEGENSAMSSQVAQELLVEDLGYDPKMLNALKGDDPIWNFVYENSLRIKADARTRIKRYTMMLSGKRDLFFDRKIEFLEDLLVIATHYAEAAYLERWSDSKTPGGIDFNAAHLDLQIKRNGQGVPLPLVQQDMAQLNLIQGFEPEIIEIKPALNVPIITELMQELRYHHT